jgi:predicted acylesterase/phospholipase RssA
VPATPWGLLVAAARGRQRTHGQVIRTPTGRRKGLRVVIAFIALTAAAIVAPIAAQVPACTTGRTALVLSGGGAKGFAHLGVLRALDSLGARPDVVVGTSIGAVVGALYASGYSAAETDSIARAQSLAALFEDKELRVPRPWWPQVPLLMWEEGEKGLSLQSPAVGESDANALLSAALLRGNLLARGEFDRMPIPFRAVATDLETRATVVLDSGDLAQAVRASSAVPLVFTPERIGSRLLSDGGLSANIPVAVARSLPGVTRVVVSDVSGRPLTADELAEGPLAVADQLAVFLFQQAAAPRRPGDVYIKVDVEGFQDLDFTPRALDSLRLRGRRAADSILSRAACLPRAPRRTPEPPTRISAVQVTGGTAAEREVLERLLGLTEGPLDEQALARELLRLNQVDAYRAVWLNPRGEGTAVEFRTQVRPASERLAGTTVIYDNDLGPRLGITYLDRRLFATALEFGLAVGLSRRESDITAGLRRYFGALRSRLSPAVVMHLAEEDIPIYSDGDQVGQPTTREAILFAGLEREFSAGWVLSAGFDGRLWLDSTRSFDPDASEDDGRSAGARLRVERHPGAVTATTELVWSTSFKRASGEYAVDFRLGTATLTPRVRAGWGDGLPLQYQFPLGGDEGFPGHPTEGVRGDREMFGSLQGNLPLGEGPVSLRAMLAAGRSAIGTESVLEHPWIGGVRVGVGIDTPLAVVRFEYGFATDESDNLFVRVGKWF